MFTLSEVPQTAKGIAGLISDYQTLSNDYALLLENFKGYQAILTTPIPGEGKPHNMLVNNFPGFITVVNVGYFVGKPVTYSSENEKFAADLMDIFKYNDEQNHNVALAKSASIRGIAYELLYTDNDSQCRFASVLPENCFVIKDTSLEANIIGAVRWVVADDDSMIVEVYDKEKVTIYKRAASRKTLVQDSVQPHAFQDVPIVVYENNSELQGDFEKVLTRVNHQFQEAITSKESDVKEAWSFLAPKKRKELVEATNVRGKKTKTIAKSSPVKDVDQIIAVNAKHGVVQVINGSSLKMVGKSVKGFDQKTSYMVRVKGVSSSVSKTEMKKMISEGKRISQPVTGRLGQLWVMV